MSLHINKSLSISRCLSFFSSRIYIFLFFLIEGLSARRAYKFGRFFGGLLFFLSINRRRIVKANVEILKEWAKKRNLRNVSLDDNATKITRKIYQTNAGNFFYSLALMNKPKTTIREHIKVRNPELLKKAHDRNQGLIILFSHSGPWELLVTLPVLLPTIFSEIKIAAMYRPLNNVYVNEWYLKKRKRFGMDLFSRDDGFLKIIRHLKNGLFLNIASDVRMHQGPKIKLFDKLASTSKIPYSLHKMALAPVLSISFIRIDDTSWEIEFKEIASNENVICSEIELLKSANEHLELTIFESPYDYFFFQDRYKN